MENKLLLILAAVTSLLALISPVTEDNYTKKGKDKLHIEAEKYLHELEMDNVYMVDSISHL